MDSLIDESASDGELASDDELDPNAVVLTEVVNLLRPVLREHVDLYSEMRRVVAGQHVKPAVLSFQTSVIADVAPSAAPATPGFDLSMIAQHLTTFRSRLRQMQLERQGAAETHAVTVAQLESENDHLQAELSMARRSQGSSSSPGEAHSHNSAPTSDPGTPRSIIRPAYRSSRVAETPQRSSGSPASLQTPTRMTPTSPWSSKRVTFPPGTE
jgi:hypothetical protein